MKKIIFLTSEIVRAGGVVRVINIWANYFAKNGDKVTIVATEVQKPYYQFYRNINIKKTYFAFYHKIIGIPLNIIQTYRLLSKLVCEENLNLIIDRAVHVEPIWILRKLGLFKNINLIYFAHGGSSDFRDFYLSRPLVAHRVKMIFDAFDKVVCLYDDEKNYPKQVKKEKLYFIPNPLPFEPEDVPDEEKENIVLSLGRVTKEKGIDILLYAWKNVEEKVKNWKLQIVGDGKDKENFQKLALKLNLKNVEFINGTTDVKPYYKKAKIFVIPSLFEGMPMTILEAMACKSCVISSKTAGGKKLIKHKERGLLFEISNHEQLSEQILMLINNKELRISLSNQAYEYVQQYKIENIAKLWDKILT